MRSGRTIISPEPGSIRPEHIVLFGRSLGAAVAGELAAQKPAAGLILESSFPSIEAVAKFHYGGFRSIGCSGRTLN